MLDERTDRELKVKIDEIRAREKSLSAWGWQYIKTGPDKRYVEGVPYEAFAMMETPEWRYQVYTAVEFIKTRRALRNLNKKITSYGWKHKAERWGWGNGLSGYVSNGAMIMAAFITGVQGNGYEGRCARSPNAFLALGAEIKK